MVKIYGGENVTARPGRRFTGAWRLAMWGTIAALLLLPLLAMQFTHEVAWTGFDFAIAAALLVGGGAAFELAMRLVPERRSIIGATIVAVVAVIWAEGAVGIFS